VSYTLVVVTSCNSKPLGQNALISIACPEQSVHAFFCYPGRCDSCRASVHIIVRCRVRPQDRTGCRADWEFASQSHRAALGSAEGSGGGKSGGVRIGMGGSGGGDGEDVMAFVAALARAAASASTVPATVPAIVPAASPLEAAAAGHAPREAQSVPLKAAGESGETYHGGGGVGGGDGGVDSYKKVGHASVHAAGAIDRPSGELGGVVVPLRVGGMAAIAEAGEHEADGGNDGKGGDNYDDDDDKEEEKEEEEEEEEGDGFLDNGDGDVCKDKVVARAAVAELLDVHEVKTSSALIMGGGNGGSTSGDSDETQNSTACEVPQCLTSCNDPSSSSDSERAEERARCAVSADRSASTLTPRSPHVGDCHHGSNGGGGDGGDDENDDDDVVDDDDDDDDECAVRWWTRALMLLLPSTNGIKSGSQTREKNGGEGGSEGRSEGRSEGGSGEVRREYATTVLDDMWSGLDDEQRDEVRCTSSNQI